MDQPHRRPDLFIQLQGHILLLVSFWVDNGLWRPACRKRPFFLSLLAVVTQLFVRFILFTGLDIPVQTFVLREAMPLLESQMEQLLRDGHA